MLRHMLDLSRGFVSAVKSIGLWAGTEYVAPPRPFKRSRVALLATICWVAVPVQGCEPAGDSDRLLQDPDENVARALAEMSALSGSDPAWMGGVLEGARCEELGEITDVVVRGHHIVVLDRRARSVKVFGEGGGCVEEVGGHGDGPGEFENPVAMDLVEDSVLVVIDSGHRRVERFGLSGGDWRHLSSIRLPFTPSGACSMDASLFSTGAHEGRMVHRFGAGDESPERSFGTWYEEAGSTVRGFLESRPLLLGCDSGSDAVIAVSELTGEVEVYTSEGLLRFAGHLPRFVGFEVVQVESGAVSLRVPEEWADVPHSVASVVIAAPGVALVQYGASTGRVENLDSVLIDLIEGRMEFVDGAWPTVRAVGEELLVTEQPSGFPRFAVYDRAENR